MNQDTIPSQLAPITIPSVLGPVGSSDHEPEPSSFMPALKWLLVAAAVAAWWLLEK